MLPFNRAHTTSYSTLIETMRIYHLPFSSYSELFVSIVANFNLPHLHLIGASVGDDPV